MAGDYQRLIHEVAELRRKIANMSSVWTVKKVKGDKVMLERRGEDGKSVESGWLHHSSFRGEMRQRYPLNPPPEQQQGQGEQGGLGTGGSGSGGTGGGSSGAGGASGGEEEYKGGGQNVMLFCPNGDVRQGVILPYAPNENNRPPDHANEYGRGEAVSQLGQVRTSFGKDGGGQQGGGQGGGQDSSEYGYDIWLEPEEKNEKWKEGKEGQPKERKTGGDKAKVKLRVQSSGGFTGRVGTDVRVAAHEKGAKTRAGKTYFVAEKGKHAYIAAEKNVHVDPEEKAYVRVPWEIKKGPTEPVPNDDK